MSKGRQKILVADDDALIQEAVINILGAHDYQVMRANSGSTAIDCTKACRPDLILMDVNMPDIDGREACRRLKADADTHDIPVIFMTAEADMTEDKVAAFEAGGVDYLLKPLQPMEVVARLRTHLRLANSLRDLQSQSEDIRQDQEDLSTFLKAQRDRLGPDGERILSNLEARQKGEHSLINASQKCQQLLEEQFSALVVTDAGQRVHHVNKSFAALSGRSAEQLQDTPIADVVFAEDREIFEKQMWRLIYREVEHFSMELRIERGDGSLIDVVSVATANFSKATDGMSYCASVSVMFHDISIRKAADRAKSDFIAALSHELRTPLAAIQGAFGLIAHSLPADENHPGRKLLDIAVRNCNRLTGVVNDLLDVDQLEHGKLQVELSSQEIDVLLYQIIENNQPMASEHGIVLSPKLASAGCRAQIDVSRLQQIVGKLISNAVKFSPGGSTVEIGTALVEDWVRISIQDCGPGIDEKFRPHVFEKFTQESGTDARTQNGTGLGLFVAKHMVLAMEGRIDFEVIPDGGTRFNVDLPLDNGDGA